MADSINLTIISDVACPWCIVGYKRLERAIIEMGIEDKVEIEWEPFELDTNMPPEGEELHAHMHKKYGMTRQDSQGFLDTITGHGAELGFTFDFFEGMTTVNTRKAHVLLEYSKEFGKQTELKLRLFNAMYNEHKNISKQEIIVQAWKDVGLDEDKAIARLADPEASKEVQAREAHWQSLGVMSVPTIIFNKKSAMNGAQPVEVYKQILTELLENDTVSVLLDAPRP